MKKSFVLLIAAYVIIALSIASIFVISKSKFEWYLAIFPVLAIVAGSIFVQKETKRKKNENLIEKPCLSDVGGGIKKGIKDAVSKIQLENAMDSLLVVEGELSKDQKRLWNLVQDNVPSNNPKKVKLKKKFFTLEFEDL